MFIMPKENVIWTFQNVMSLSKRCIMRIVGTHCTLFRYTSYIPWDIWLAKFRFHEYACGRGVQSFFNEIACYNKILFNLNDVILGFSYLRKETNAHVFTIWSHRTVCYTARSPIWHSTNQRSCLRYIQLINAIVNITITKSTLLLTL